MKRFATMLFTAAILITGTAFANNGAAPTQQAQAGFNRLFAGATTAQWKTVANLYEVQFEKDGQYLTAFFNADGQMQSLARNITTSALPLLLQKGLHQKKAGGWISESFELVGEKGTEYFITVETSDNSTVYRATDGDWNVYKKIRK